MVDALGYLNLILILVMTSMYVVKQLAMTRGRSKIWAPIYQRMRKIHPALGIVVISIGMIHGSLALGTLRMHTGLLLVMTLVLAGLVALAGSSFPYLKSRWREAHRSSTLFVFIALMIHMFWRNLI